MPNPSSNPCAGFVRPSLAVAVANHLKELIARGVFDRRLPGERELALMLKVGRPAVRQALDGLAKDGLIERGQGRSTRIMRASMTE
jgi:GntR family transcriptional repressor for pyruvate dehydrogenase complex